MNHLSVALLLLALAGAAGATPTPQPPPADLRQALQQYQKIVAPAPRQLSAEERAELRRQLAEQGQPTSRRR